MALAIFVATLCVDAYPIYEASDTTEITDEDRNKPTQCQLHVSNIYMYMFISNNTVTIVVW